MPHSDTITRAVSISLDTIRTLIDIQDMVMDSAPDLETARRYSDALTAAMYSRLCQDIDLLEGSNGERKLRAI